jgi:hypothetical protein
MRSASVGAQYSKKGNMCSSQIKMFTCVEATITFHQYYWPGWAGVTPQQHVTSVARVVDDGKTCQRSGLICSPGKLKIYWG